MKQLWVQFTFVTTLLCINLTYAQSTFTNPLLPSGADPWCIYKDGYYYYTNTTGKNITLWKTTDIATLSTSEKKIVWTPPTPALIQNNYGPLKSIIYGANGISILPQMTAGILITCYTY